MKKISLSIILDTATSFVAIYLLFVVALKNHLSVPVRITVSMTLSALFSLLVFRILYGKRQKKLCVKADELKYKSVMTALNFSSKKDLTALFIKAFNKTGKPAEQVKDGILIKDDNALFRPFFSFEEPTKKDILKTYNMLTGGKKGIIASETFSDEITAFSRRFNGRITLCDGKTAYNLFKSADMLSAFDDCPVFTETEKKKFCLSNLLHKKTAVKFAVFGGFMILFSFFVPIKIYYLLFGALFILFSIVIKLFGKES